KLIESEGLEFRALPIESGVLNMQIVLDGEDTKAPVILESYISGMAHKNPEGVTNLSALGSETKKEIQNIFGQAAGGEVIINTLAACKIREKTPNGDTRIIAGIIKPTATFKYGVQVDRRIEVAYRETHF